MADERTGDIEGPFLSLYPSQAHLSYSMVMPLASTKMDEIKIWDVGLCFQPTPRPAELEGPEEEEEESWALLILNQPLFLSLETFTTLWNKGKESADGADAPLYSILSFLPSFLPSFLLRTYLSLPS